MRSSLSGHSPSARLCKPLRQDYIGCMRAVQRLPSIFLVTGAFLLAPLGVGAQDVAPHYRLAPSPWSLASTVEGAARTSIFQFGPVSLGTGSGGGLSLQAGQEWFARAAIGSTLKGDLASIGGGYRFRDGDALSMHVTRQLGQEGLGLAVRYDRAAAYLRLSYESRLGQVGQAEMLRFSAGMRF